MTSEGQTPQPTEPSTSPGRKPVKRKIPWPHAPTHMLAASGTYFVSAGTYLKAHYFRARQRLEVLHRGLLTVARDFGWSLEAWAANIRGARPDGSSRPCRRRR